MNYRRLPLLTVFATALVFAPTQVFCQGKSDSPQLGGQTDTRTNALTHEVAQSAAKDNLVTNSVSPGIISIERKLADAKWGDVAPGEGEIPFSDLIANIERLGIPVVLDESSDLKPDSGVAYLTSKASKNLPLDDGLGILMRCHNSDYKVTSNAIHIFSVDQMAEELDRVVYNVSPLIDNQGSDIDIEQLNVLIRLIQDSVEPVSWEVEGPSIRYVANGTQGLLVIVNTYDVHRKLRRLFEDMSAQSAGPAIGRQAILEAEKKKAAGEQPMGYGTSPISERFGKSASRIGDQQ